MPDNGTRMPRGFDVSASYGGMYPNVDKFAALPYMDVPTDMPEWVVKEKINQRIQGGMTMEQAISVVAARYGETLETITDLYQSDGDVVEDNHPIDMEIYSQYKDAVHDLWDIGLHTAEKIADGIMPGTSDDPEMVARIQGIMDRDGLKAEEPHMAKIIKFPKPSQNGE